MVIGKPVSYSRVFVNGLPLRQQSAAVSISAAGWVRDTTAKGKWESCHRGHQQNGEGQSYWLILTQSYTTFRNMSKKVQIKIILISILAGTFVLLKCKSN